MSKLAVGIVAIVGVSVGLSSAAAATPAPAPGGPGHGDGDGGPQGTELAVSGPFTATGTLGTAECQLFHQVVDGEGDWTSLGVSTFHLDFCLATPSAGYYPVYDGSFTITAAHGGTLTGDLGGNVEAGFPGPEFPLHLVMTVTGGSGPYAGATGSIAMEGAFSLGAVTAEGTVDGTVILPARTPSSLWDCLHGGWRDLVDGHGQLFRNQGRCVAWAVHHT